MAEEENTDEGNEVEESGGSGGKGPLVTILLVLNAVIMGVVAYMQYMAHQREMNRPELRDIVRAQIKDLEKEMALGEEGDNKDENQGGALLQLQPFTANLAQGDGPRRYIRLNTVLKFSKDSKEQEYSNRKAQIRDAVISILNSKRPEDLLKVEGKEYLKEEIKSSINSFLIDGKVVDVFYVGFQIN